MKKWMILIFIVLAGAGATWALNARVTETVQVTVRSLYRTTNISRYGPGISGIMVVVTDQGEFAFPESRAAHQLAKGQTHHWQVSRPLIGEARPLVEAFVATNGNLTPVKQAHLKVPPSGAAPPAP
ncbi:MAG: hypothetical protein ACE366_03680 [Bradymonadia bacterium]